jgi:hypothetical protein
MGGQDGAGATIRHESLKSRPLTSIVLRGNVIQSESKSGGGRRRITGDRIVGMRMCRAGSEEESVTWIAFD